MMRRKKYSNKRPFGTECICFGERHKLHQFLHLLALHQLPMAASSPALSIDRCMISRVYLQSHIFYSAFGTSLIKFYWFNCNQCQSHAFPRLVPANVDYI